MTPNPGTAAILSFFWTGLGQIYNGQIGKGLLFMIVQAINVCLIFALIGLLTFPVFWLYGILDAKKTAEGMAAKTVA
ncbi:MAG: hypothetical protein WC455_31370 [Dehalococcoidia bacterium]